LFLYDILGIFDSRREAFKHEIDLHNFYNVGVNEEFINKAKCTSIGFNREGVKMSEESKSKMKTSKMKICKNGKTISQNSSQKMAETRKNTLINGVPLSQIISNKAAKTTKESGVLKGKNNPRARKINIFNKNGVLMFSSHGNLKEVCEKNSIPYGEVICSLYKKRPMYPSEKIVTRITNNGNIKFKGWYVKYEDK
jgi:hypothetical protein